MKKHPYKTRQRLRVLERKIFLMNNIVSDIFNKINAYFLHDEDEQALASEYFIFYGTNGIGLLLSILFLMKIITF